MVQKAATLLDIDLKGVLRALARAYGLRLPGKVVMVDYGDDVGDLFVQFRHVPLKEGEPTKDGNAILHYGADGRLAAVEIRDLTKLPTGGQDQRGSLGVSGVRREARVQPSPHGVAVADSQETRDSGFSG